MLESLADEIKIMLVMDLDGGSMGDAIPDKGMCDRSHHLTTDVIFTRDMTFADALPPPLPMSAPVM